MEFMPWSHPWLLSTPHQSANLIDSIFKECTDPNYFPLSLLPLLCSNQIAASNYCIRLPTTIFLPLPSWVYYKQNREKVLKCSQIMSLLCSKSFNGSCYLSDFIIYNSPSHFYSNHTYSLLLPAFKYTPGSGAFTGCYLFLKYPFPMMVTRPAPSTASGLYPVITSSLKASLTTIF